MSGLFTCRAFEAPLRQAPDPAAEQADQLLHGEGFTVEREEGGWAFGRALRDGYAGWVAREALGAWQAPPALRVAALRTYVFSRPHLKSAPWGQLSLNALLPEGEAQDGFAPAAGGWVWRGHLAPAGAGFARDPAAVAMGFLGAPYRWGGRDSLGLDCSGLVQQALYACGRACPRDSGDQRRMGRPLAEGEAPRRGDLAFWPGHVAMLLDGALMVHANAFHMAVAAEALAEAQARIGPAHLRRL